MLPYGCKLEELESRVYFLPIFYSTSEVFKPRSSAIIIGNDDSQATGIWILPNCLCYRSGHPCNYNNGQIDLGINPNTITNHPLTDFRSGKDGAQIQVYIARRFSSLCLIYRWAAMFISNHWKEEYCRFSDTSSMTILANAGQNCRSSEGV